MEQVNIFSGYCSDVRDDINNWLKKEKPIVTRVLQSSAGSSSQYITITIFYQEPIKSPK